MKKLILVLALLALVPATASADTFSLSADWSDTTNPNGAWSYLVNGLPGVTGTRGGEMSWGVPGPPLIWTCSGSGEGCFSSGSYAGWSQSNGSQQNISPGELGVGDIYGHTSYDGPIEIRWTSPVAGSVEVLGSVWAIRDMNRTNNWALTLNGSELLSGVVGTGYPYARSNPALVSLTLTVDVGDVLAFSASPTSGSYPDYIALDLGITPSIPEPASLLLLGTGLVGLGRAWRRRCG